MYLLSVHEQEEANSLLMCFERALCAGAELGSSHFFLFACLNCDLYLFVQMQESSVQSCCP